MKSISGGEKMNKLLKMLLIGLMMVTVLSACGAKTVKITADNNGQTITLKQGETLSLSINGNPTTGYGWEVSEVDANILASAGEADYKSDSNLVGAGGTYTFKFTAENAGTTALKLKYWRSFEPDVAPIDVFEITVIVE
jgi:inhibitor of cysteine peptidase